MNPAALLDLASDPRLIPHLLERVHRAAQGKVDLEVFSLFLPALARCREVLGDDIQYAAATSGCGVSIDRQSLLDRVEQAEQALSQAFTQSG